MGFAADQLLGERQIVVRLALIVGENVSIVPLVTRPYEPAIECCQDQVRSLPILLRATAKHEIELRATAIIIEREETVAQYRSAIRLDRIEQRPAVEPDEFVEERERVRRSIGSAITGAQGLAGGLRHMARVEASAQTRPGL
jgi:hypothetical protein